MKRRDAIKTLGALAGAAGMSRLLTACASDDADEAGIDTLVFMMMENRSYDHYLGARSLLEGLPGNGLTQDMSNPNTDGASVGIMPADAAAMCVLDPPHGWDDSRLQFGDGKNDGFVIAQQQKHDGVGGLEPMQYMVREHIPVTWALADAYTSCDNWFCSVLGGTLPNRMYWHAATSNGAKANSEVLDGAFSGVPTIYHSLDAAGIDWAYYFGDVPVLGVIDTLETKGRLRRFFYDFIDDAAAGKLPPVVYIDPSFSANDDHPPHHPLLGQQLIAATYQALATSPHWKRCMLVITYDENGGFFDHVVPPRVDDPRAADGFDQLGFRVPTLVAGPYAKQGHVSSVQYDHCSALRHIESVFALDHLNVRTEKATDLSDCIDLERLAAGMPADPITLPAVEVDESMLGEACSGVSFRGVYDHDIVEWAANNTARLGSLDRRHETRDYVYGIADYLDRHNLGRIRRGR